MRRDLFEMQYFETYYVANQVSNLVYGAFSEYEFLGLTGQFFGDNPEVFSAPFPKQSALHYYIKWVLDIYNSEDLDEKEINKVLSGEHVLWVDLAFRHYGYQEDFYKYLQSRGKKFKTAVPDDISEYLEELLLCGPYEELLETIAEEVFFILFLNREFLGKFNNVISHYLSGVSVEYVDEGFKDNFKRDGVLKRRNIPEWVKTAVFHRDRGRCSMCPVDLTGMITISNKKNFDHVVPLAAGGTNDVTNIQLLCESCNKSKSSSLIAPSKFYEKWY